MIIRNHLGNKNIISVIYGADLGSCDDLEALNQANAFISSNKSANAWCAVQAKSEGLPSVIGFDTIFQNNNGEYSPRSIFNEDLSNSIQINANTINFKESRISIREGDHITIDGNLGKIFLGVQTTYVSPLEKLQTILIPILVEAINKFGPEAAWTRFHELKSYKQSSEILYSLVEDPLFQKFQTKFAIAREKSPLQIRSTIHTQSGAIQARLFDCDINLAKNKKIQIVRNNKYTGIGLLRTERLFIQSRDLDNLRAYLLCAELGDQPLQKAIGEEIYNFQKNELTKIFMTNSQLPTVVRTLCMPFNKLFIDTDSIKSAMDTWKLQEITNRNEVLIKFQESDTFHGCRGARLHTLIPDLAKIEIKAILEAASEVISIGGSIDLTILVSMVTFPEEIQFYAELVDEVYDELILQGKIIPPVKLATMIETTAAYLNIERFAATKSKHTEFIGILFGGNDFTAACLNLSRTDAVHSMIPNYQRLGIFKRDPFFCLHSETVGKAI